MLPEYKFIWFGYSPLEVATEPVRKAVNTKLDNLVFAGYVEKEEIRNALNGCDVYVFPTYEETEGIPIIEAMACKCDSIVRDIKIFDDWLIDGKNMYKAKDINEFKEKIIGICEKKLPSLVDNYDDVVKERDINNVAKKLKEVYLDVLK